VSEPALTAGQVTKEAVRTAAIRMFRERGFEATTMRQLADAVGIEAASLYNHYSSKHQLLAEVLIPVMEQLIGRLREEIAATGDDPARQLDAAVRCYILFHQDYLDEAGITDSERRSLKPEDFRRLLDLRRELADLFNAIIAAGADRGVFHTEDVAVASLAVLSICARLPVWFTPDGRLTLDKVADILARTALRAVGWTGSDGAS
jgi:AcrR family transcriptional regulator